MTRTRAALEKFGEDAQRWYENSSQLATAQAAASALSIEPLAFGPAAWLGVAGSYRQVQQMIVDRLGEGAAVSTTIAETLITVRDRIQATEDANEAALRGAASGE